MGTKMIKIPFDIELAKKITNGEVEGKVVTRDSKSVRIICFDQKCGGGLSFRLFSIERKQRRIFYV